MQVTLAQVVREDQTQAPAARITGASAGIVREFAVAPPDLLVNIADLGTAGAFAQLDAARELEQVRILVLADALPRSARDAGVRGFRSAARSRARGASLDPGAGYKLAAAPEGAL